MIPKRPPIGDRPHHDFTPSVEELERIVVPSAPAPHVHTAVVTHAGPGRPDNGPAPVQVVSTTAAAPRAESHTVSAVPGMSFARALTAGTIAVPKGTDAVVHPDDSSGGGGGSSFAGGGGGTTYVPTGYGSSSFNAGGSSPGQSGYTTQGGVPTTGGGASTFFGGSAPTTAGYSTHGGTPTTQGGTTGGFVGGSTFNAGGGGYTSYGASGPDGYSVFNVNGNSGMIPGGGTIVRGGTVVNANGTTPIQGGVGTTPMQGGVGTTPMQGGVGTTPMQGGVGTTPNVGSPGYPYQGNDTSIFNNPNGGFTPGPVGTTPSPGGTHGGGPPSSGSNPVGIWYGSAAVTATRPSVAAYDAAGAQQRGIAPPGAVPPAFATPPASVVPVAVTSSPSPVAAPVLSGNDSPPQVASGVTTIPLVSAQPEGVPSVIPTEAVSTPAPAPAEPSTPATSVLVDPSGPSPNATSAGFEDASPFTPANDESPAEPDVEPLPVIPGIAKATTSEVPEAHDTHAADATAESLVDLVLEDFADEASNAGFARHGPPA